MHAFERERERDRQTNGQTDSFLLTRPPCIQCSAAMMAMIMMSVIS